jgi:hypothetical protein
MAESRRKLIGCAAVIEEMLPLLPPDLAYEILDFGLHFRPSNLKNSLQTAIDASPPEVDTIIIGYGLCGNGALGLKAPKRATLVIPKVHDCIAMFLGSHESYKKQVKAEAGTFFFAKGFMEVGDTPLDEYRRTVDRYGEERADRVMRTMFGHYTRLLFINTGHHDLSNCREHALQMAQQFSLRYEETKGSRALLEKLIHGPWDNEFILVKPDESVTIEQFLRES